MGGVVWIINGRVSAQTRVYLRKVQIALEELISVKIDAMFAGKKVRQRRTERYDLVHFWWLSGGSSWGVRYLSSIHTPIPFRGYPQRKGWYVADTSKTSLWLRGLGVHPSRIFSIYRTELEPAEFASALALVYDYILSLQEVE